MEIIHGLLIHSERWSSLELKMSSGWICEVLSYASFPAVNLTKLHITLVGPFQLPHRPPVLDILSVSPLKEVHFEHVTYSSMPINTTELAFLPYNRRRSCSKIPIIFDHISLPALQLFEILADKQHHDMMNLEPIEYLRLHGLFRRSQCRLTVLIFSVLISIQSLLIPILAQSPAVKRLEIFVNITIARKFFGLLHHSSWGNIRWLDIPLPTSSPFRNLLKIKLETMDVKLLLDGKDYLVDEARVTFFGD
ncbi:hypothetical protein EDD85DRAFT_784185 [Armillaria nabsnona]|nr:hypothetical protein EDD85DRAFT_784185 [Armillaria nabsnona]